MLKDPARFRPIARHATDAAVAFLAVGATLATIDRLGVRPFDFASEIILLTAVHFHFAGFVLPLAGALAYARRPGLARDRAGRGVVAGIPITALGFLGIPYANWVGAILTAVGGFGIGVATVLVARCMNPRSAKVLGIVAGAEPPLFRCRWPRSMRPARLLGASWLDLATMARIHGGLNALGFAVPVIVAWTLASPRTPEDPQPRAGIRPHVVGMVAAITMAVYALAVIAVSLASADDIGPPDVIPQGVSIGLVLLVPAGVAAIGATRRIPTTPCCRGRTRPAAIALCTGVHRANGRAVVAWRDPARVRTRGRAPTCSWVSPSCSLGYAALLVPNTLTEPRCWTATQGPGGALVYAVAPITETLQLGPGQVGAGCEGRVQTVQGAGVGLVLAIGAVRDRDPGHYAGRATAVRDMTRFRLETLIDAPIERVFDLARDIGFHERSMTDSGERAIAGGRAA